MCKKLCFGHVLVVCSTSFVELTVEVELRLNCNEMKKVNDKG